MVFDKHVVVEFDVRESVVIGGSVEEETGAKGKKRDVEGPDVFEGRFDGEDLFATNQGFVGVGSSIEGEDLDNSPPEFFPDRGGENKKEGDVGEERDDENVREKDAGREGERTKKKLVGVDLGHRLLEGALPEEIEGDLTSNEDTEMGACLPEGKVFPGAIREINADAGPVGGGGRGNSSRFVPIDPQPRHNRKKGNKRKRRRDMSNRVGEEREVIGEGKGENPLFLGKEVKERVVGDNKKEGREGAPLFDSPENGNPVSEGAAKEGRDVDRRHGALDKILEPGGEVGFVENVTDPFVIDGVEGFGSVEKEEQLVLFFFDRFVEEVIDSHDVVSAILARQETLLARVNIVVHSWHNTVGNSGSQDPIVCVGNTEGTSVSKETSVFFRKEE